MVSPKLKQRQNKRKIMKILILDDIKHHDLGDFVNDADTYVDGWGSTRKFNGGHASMRVCELEDDKLPEKVIVHSINSVGAKNMISNCQRRGIPVVWEPFSDPN
jgi:hypothetical protein